MKRTARLLRRLSLPLLALTLTLPAADVVEEIYAVVNDEIITLSDLHRVEKDGTRYLQSKFQGEALTKAIAEMKAGLLDKMIDERILLSQAKEKNLNVDADVDLFIAEVKKQHNLASDEELIRALAQDGISLKDFKAQWRDGRLQSLYVWNEVGSKIKIDNAEIMAYYKKEAARFTSPLTFTLTAVFLKKEGRDGAQLDELKRQISAEITPQTFVAVAGKRSELGGEPDGLLGTFKQGELQVKLEEEALKLKDGEISPWIETEPGWYLLQMKERKEPRPAEYKDVREDIITTLREQHQIEKLKDFMADLRKQSVIRILKEYK